MKKYIEFLESTNFNSSKYNDVLNNLHDLWSVNSNFIKKDNTQVLKSKLSNDKYKDYWEEIQNELKNRDFNEKIKLNISILISLGFKEKDRTIIRSVVKEFLEKDQFDKTIIWKIKNKLIEKGLDYEADIKTPEPVKTTKRKTK